jgi:hypothetical protein
MSVLPPHLQERTRRIGPRAVALAEHALLAAVDTACIVEGALTSGINTAGRLLGAAEEEPCAS